MHGETVKFIADILPKLNDLTYTQTVRATGLTHFSGRYSARLSNKTHSLTRSGGIPKYDSISDAYELH